MKTPDKAIIAACSLANQDIDAKAIEAEFDALQDPILEPWDDSTPNWDPVGNGAG